MKGASLFFAELRKVWGGKVFPLMLAVLASANLLLLWLGTRPTASQPPAEAYRAVGQAVSGMSMAEKGAFLHSKYAEMEALLKIGQYYRELAWGGYNAEQYREQNTALFEQYEEEYQSKSYELYTGGLAIEFRLFSQLQAEFDTVNAYPDFLQSVRAKADQLAGISIFQNDKTGYDQKNIEVTARVYAGLGETPIDYYPQKGLYTAISYEFTDLLLLAAMLILALLLVRQERDSGLLGLVRSLPGGRLQTAAAKLAAFGASMLGALLVLYGVNLAYCGAAFGLGPLTRTIQSVPALMRCTMQITVGQYLFRFLLAKWAGAFVMGLWVMLAALTARRAAAGWVGALALPLAMYAVRAAVPAASHKNVIKYANLFSLLQTNELLGNYRNLYWFGAPVGLPLVEWTAAAAYGAVFAAAFCLVFARAQLLPAPARSFSLGVRRRTHPVTIWGEEGRKLFLKNGAALFLAAFAAYGAYQGAAAQSYVDADEIYYAYYMKAVSGPYTAESYQRLLTQGEEFAPMLEAQRKVAAGEWNPDVMMAYYGLQQKYSAYRKVTQNNIGCYLKEHPGAWLVYETGYRKLLGFAGTADLQDTLLAGLLCALCFSGLFAMERKGGMDEILRATPLGRRDTVRAKLVQSALAAVGIAAATCLPHVWQAMRDYGLPAVTAPAMSISELEAVPACFTLADVLLFWFLCRAAACLAMGAATLWLGHKFGSLLPALFVSAAAWCLPPLLALSGMRNGIQWLGAYPLFHAAALLQNQGWNAENLPYNYAKLAFLLLAFAAAAVWTAAQLLAGAYEWAGLRMEA